MMTVTEVSRLTGVSVRALHHYDTIGLLAPSQLTPSGYRLYGEAELERLQHILLFKELQFPLKDIRQILDSPDFDRNRAVEQQLHLLQLRKEHLDNLIDLARGIHMIGVKNLDFSAFDTKKIDEYSEQAKAAWGKSPAYKEFEKKSKNRTAEEEAALSEKMMAIFDDFGVLFRQGLAPSSTQAQKQVENLKNFLTEHFYTCTPEILKSLGDMYSGGGRFTENIDARSGKGTAVFAGDAIRWGCNSLET